jgi:hypothetical protein
MRYARRTKVTISKSRSEIESIVERYGADQFGSAFDRDGLRAMIQFRIDRWLVRFILPLPNQKETDERQRWRALALVIKAKLEAVESGITAFEEEFLPHIVMPTGQTVGEWAGPQLRDLKERGQFSSTIAGLLEGKK